MWDRVIAIGLVAAGAAYAVYLAYRRLTGKGGCGCSCNRSCPAAKTHQQASGDKDARS